MMTDNEIIIEIAKLDGWSFADRVTEKKSGDSWDVYERDGKRASIYTNMLSAYLTSRDAIVPVIEKQKESVKVDMFANFAKEFKHPTAERFISELFVGWLEQTAHQLCIALLRATGKWKE